jgi:hypothetical protein
VSASSDRLIPPSLRLPRGGRIDPTLRRAMRPGWRDRIFAAFARFLAGAWKSFAR